MPQRRLTESADAARHQDIACPRWGARRGKRAEGGEKSLAAVKQLRPSLAKKEKTDLPRAVKALRGLGKAAPNFST